MGFMLACFFTFLFNWLFLIPVSKLYHHGIDDDDSTIDEKVEFWFFWTCSLFQLVKCAMQFFMMHILIKLTDDRNIRKFERMLSENSIRLTDIRVSAEFTFENKIEKSNSNT